MAKNNSFSLGGDDHFSIWRRPKGYAAVKLMDDAVGIIGGPTHGIFSSSELGNILKGPTSITATPGQIRIGGLWTMNPLLMMGLPSTMVSPIPTLVFNPPVQGIKRMAEQISKLASIF